MAYWATLFYTLYFCLICCISVCGTSVFRLWVIIIIKYKHISYLKKFNILCHCFIFEWHKINNRNDRGNGATSIKYKKKRYSHWLGELRGLIVDVCHPHTDCSGARMRLVPTVHCHHHKFIQMVGSLIIQPARRENSPMGWNTEVWAQGVICEFSI